MSEKTKITIEENIFEKNQKPKIKKKDEFIGIIYSIITQLIWTINSINLKYFINNNPSIFKNKTFLFPRGLTTIIISLILGKMRDGKIYSFNFFDSSVQKCILIKANLSFFAMCFWTIAVSYLRITTCQVISSLSPILVITFSVLFLKEQFHYRYFLGILTGTIGSIIIILDEKIIQENNTTYHVKEYIIGIIGIIMNIVLSSFNNIANKYMAKRASIYTQMFYLGIFHCFYSLLWMLFTWDFDYNLKYFFGCALHSILFFLGNIFYNLSLSKLSMSKYSILQYSKFVFAFILGWGVLKEDVLFNDMIGTTIIGGYLIFDVMFPIIQK